MQANSIESQSLDRRGTGGGNGATTRQFAKRVGYNKAPNLANVGQLPAGSVSQPLSNIEATGVDC